MLQILALLLGFGAWGILVVAIAKTKVFTKERLLRLRFVSWFCCAVALYIPSLCQYLEFRVASQSLCLYRPAWRGVLLP